MLARTPSSLWTGRVRHPCWPQVGHRRRQHLADAVPQGVAAPARWQMALAECDPVRLWASKHPHSRSLLCAWEARGLLLPRPFFGSQRPCKGPWSRCALLTGRVPAGVVHRYKEACGCCTQIHGLGTAPCVYVTDPAVFCCAEGFMHTARSGCVP